MILRKYRSKFIINTNISKAINLKYQNLVKLLLESIHLHTYSKLINSNLTFCNEIDNYFIHELGKKHL